MIERLLTLPLILVLTGASAVAMLVPSIHALAQGNFHTARSFLYASLLSFALVVAVAITVSGRPQKPARDLENLLSLFLAFSVLPVVLAVPFHEALGTTTFLNSYFEMVSSLTTTGASLFEPERLNESLHLWRGLVAWLGGLLIWIAASAILAPLNLGGFEVTATAEPGYDTGRLDRFERANSAKRLAQITSSLVPVYAGLTLGLWILLMVGGDRSLVAVIHAMSTMATSGISPIGGIENASSGFGGEAVVFLFLLFALSRLTFSADTSVTQRTGLAKDPEFRLGLVLVVGVPLLLFARHWIAAFDVDEIENAEMAMKALWGGMFTVLSFLSTTGFASADWVAARDWSGLGTPGLVLLGLAVVGGGVATTAGGVKLLRVYALYLNGRREMERLVHPSSVGQAGVVSRRIRRQGAFVAWVFFMLFALSIALITVVLAALGQSFEASIVLAVSAISTTGPLVSVAIETPIALVEMKAAGKAVLCAAMVLGRLETLAIIALLNPGLWRD